jgi:glycosyltransferase involved in cell wall biosynthesis
MAVNAFGGQLEERLTIYDCMDQLSQFRGAPPELIRRERALLASADLVFAGGPKLHKEKRLSNANCHCYGCGVDVGHFGQARHAATKVPSEIAKLPRPLAGYFGVVDERLDYALIERLARAHPEWSIVIIGPTTKINPETLPRGANLHWLGGRDYQDLPAYVKGMDLCLMPFALNEATAFINPTKALEYMSTARPVVSTAVEDVVLQFSHIIKIAHSHAGFVTACEQSIAQPDGHQIEAGVKLAHKNSWEAIVEALEGHIATALVSRRGKEIFAL